VVAPLVIFAPTFSEMVGIWWRSDTFTHCFLVLPAFAYLTWMEREELQACAVRPAPLALVAVFGAGFLWALGVLSAALTPSFFGLIGMSMSAVVAVLGWRVARAIWVPLLFLIFAVPFGEVFVPALVEWTADFTVAALRASGVPVFREGSNFVIPSGSWSVVDACSGIRYLLASLFVGWLFAWLTFSSTSRRLVFMAASLVVPIVANWLRAYMIVMLGHLSNNKIATGVDHLVYGWVFFGAVMLALFWVGSRFREDRGDAKAGATVLHEPATAAPIHWRSMLPMAAAVVAIAIGWQAAVTWLVAAGDRRPVVIQPIVAANGWTSLAPDANDWSPDLRAPAATLAQRFGKGDKRVSVFVGVYRNQRQESELINSTNDLLHLIVRPWYLAFESTQTVKLGATGVRVNAALGRREKETLGVWQWHWVSGRPTTNDTWAKAALAVDRLLGRSDTSAWIAIHGTDLDDGRMVQEMLRDFAADMGPAIDDALRKTAER
jgi:exosortase A